jgi:hypothetical protein
MTGNCHVRFLGEGATAVPFPYPTPQRWGAEDAGIIGGWSEGRRLPPLIERFMLFAEVRDLYDPDCRIQMC